MFSDDCKVKDILLTGIESPLVKYGLVDIEFLYFYVEFIHSPFYKRRRYFSVSVALLSLY